jgi:hypothetical protein
VNRVARGTGASLGSYSHRKESQRGDNRPTRNQQSGPAEDVPSAVRRMPVSQVCG